MLLQTSHLANVVQNALALETFRRRENQGEKMIRITGWKSKALWSKIGVSEDEHYDRGAAYNVSHILRRDYSVVPCAVRGLCCETWIEPVLVEIEDAPQETAEASALRTTGAA